MVPTRVAAVLAVVVVLGSCAGAGDEAATAEPGAADPTVDAPVPDGAPDAGADGPTDPAVADAALLAAVEDVVAGTAAASVVAVAPADLLAASDVVCDALDGGATLDAVLADALSQLPGDDLDGEAALAGAVVGASITTHCPRHEELLP